MNWGSILKSFATIFGVFKPNEAIQNARAEKRRIRNKTKEEKSQTKILRQDIKQERLKRRLEKQRSK